MVRFEDVSSISELNQKVTDYMAIGYEVKRKTSKFVILTGEKSSKSIRTQNDTLIVNPSSLAHGKIPITGVDRGGSNSTITDVDDVIIRVKNEDNASSPTVEYCTECGSLFSEGAEFCRKCGNSYQEIQQTFNNTNNNVNCPFCWEKIPVDTFSYCCYCGMSLYQEDGRDVHSLGSKNFAKKSIMKVRGFFEK